MKKNLIAVIISFALIVFCGCVSPENTSEVYSSPRQNSELTGTFLYNDVLREYILYIPDDLPENAPLVIGLHGYTSSPWTFKNNFGWDELAEQNKFIMCYPQGTYEPYNDFSHWNARLALSTVDDVGFISSLALYLAKKYSLDENRIFIAGFSNGGYMAYTLACERPDVFRAAASVSGLMSEYTFSSYNPYNLSPGTWLEYLPAMPIPICHIHGTADRIVPIDGSEYLPEFKSRLSARETVEFWAGINQCTITESKSISEDVTAYYYINPNNSVQVWYYEYEGWTHFWPSENYIVDQPSQINAQDIIWEFFSLYK